MIDAVTLTRLMAEPVNADEAKLRRGRHLDTVFLMGIDEKVFYLTVEGGRVTSIEAGPKPLKAVSFAIHAPWTAWVEFWRPTPKAGFHDILGLAKLKHARIEGDVEVLLRHLRYFKELLAAPRGSVEAKHG